MKIGLLVTSIGNFGQKGFYNSQEIGFAKALTKYFEEVIVYKLVTIDQQACTEIIENCEGYNNASLRIIPSKNFGINGILDVNVLDKNIDILVCFSDTQISLPSVYKWTKKNNVKFFPYIGVLESHSTSRIKKIIIDILAFRNIRIYKKCHCMVKTPSVISDFKKHGIYSATVAPVGLDTSLLKKEYLNYSKSELKDKYGFKDTEKVILFIGRMIEEKQPFKMVGIFAEVLKKDENYRLLMVGTGELKNKVIETIGMYEINDKVQMIDRIPNSDIWELFRMADCFVNLNQQEIFGMAILEAMYYGCKVVAWHAPGPDFIIEDGKSGCLCSNKDEIIDAIVNRTIDEEDSKKHILDSFTWNNAAKVITDIVKGI